MGDAHYAATGNQEKSGPAAEPDPHDFGAAEKALNDAAKNVNVVWLAFISLCTYVFIATYTVTPAALFRDATVKLPIFNADLPLTVYFVMAPLLIISTHAYLIVLTKTLSEKNDTYEDILRRSVNMPAKIAAGRRSIRMRLDNSIILGAIASRYRNRYGSVQAANGLIANLTTTVMPITLLLLTQLIFMPYQHEALTWVHRSFVTIDVIMCFWLLWPWWPLAEHHVVIAGRFLVLAIMVSAVAISILFATFPGELIYNKLSGFWPHTVTKVIFEGPVDPIDYINKGGIMPFPNRLILPDDPKLAVVAGAPSDGISLSVRGRNFRKAVFDRSNLVRVDFSAADLRGASLRGTRLVDQP